MSLLSRRDFLWAGSAALLFAWASFLALFLHAEVARLLPADAPSCHALAGMARLTHHQKLWEELECERLTVFSKEEIVAAVNSRPHHERRLKEVGGRALNDVPATLPVIAVCVYASSTGHAPGNPPLNRMLHSLGETAEPGFEYRVYVVFDEGDREFDLDASLKATVKDSSLLLWFQTEVEAPLAERGIVTSLLPIRFRNRLRKPGPAINVAVRAAYEDGADYLYRVHQESEFETPWAAALVGELQASSPPNLGVVGPQCRQASEASFVHDMTHRTHLDIFGTHHPVEVEGWSAGEWIARVYGGLDSRHARSLSSVRVKRYMGPASRQSSRLVPLRRQLNIQVKRGVEAVLAYVAARVDALPLDPTLYDTTPDRASLSKRAKALYINGVYDEKGRVLVEPEGTRHTEADSRQARFLKSWREVPAPSHVHSDHSMHWEHAMEDFYVIRRLAKARISHCISSGLC